MWHGGIPVCFQGRTRCVCAARRRRLAIDLDARELGATDALVSGNARYVSDEHPVATIAVALIRAATRS
jgi:hypothetical protein